MNGNVGTNTEIFIDGAPANERLVNGSITEVGPFIEMVGEVTVSANAFNAEYGGFGAFFTNVTIRSGTNTLHGSIFDHLGNSALNARSFFQPFITPYRQNEGGFTLGGPVVIPKIYNGRNKTFFFGTLGLFYSRSGASNAIITIPTQAMVKGDFSAFPTTRLRKPPTERAVSCVRLSRATSFPRGALLLSPRLLAPIFPLPTSPVPP
jgi:hypothetical protein